MTSNALFNRRIESFDFAALAAAFDATQLSSWSPVNALAAHHLGGSDSAALGGDLAYRYGLRGGLGEIGFTPAVGILAVSGFGSAAQALQPLSSLQDGSLRLS